MSSLKHVIKSTTNKKKCLCFLPQQRVKIILGNAQQELSQYDENLGLQLLLSLFLGAFHELCNATKGGGSEHWCNDLIKNLSKVAILALWKGGKFELKLCHLILLNWLYTSFLVGSLKPSHMMNFNTNVLN